MFRCTVSLSRAQCCRLSFSMHSLPASSSLSLPYIVRRLRGNCGARNASTPSFRLFDNVFLYIPRARLHTSSVMFDGNNSVAIPAVPTIPPSSSADPLPTFSTRPSDDKEGEAALDTAMHVNKLKRLHQTGGSSSSKKKLEADAWMHLNGLTEEQINCATGKAVSLLLNSWAYFAKFWENGKDGPAHADGSAASSETKH